MTDISDHFANFIILHSNIKSKKPDRPMVRIYNEQNKNTFQKLLGDVNLDIELEHKTVNQVMMTFNQKLQLCIINLSRSRDGQENGSKLNQIKLGLKKV